MRAAAAVGAMALLYVLDGPANQHEWAVGWLRRYEQFRPLKLLALISLERFALAAALFIFFVLIDKLRNAPKDPKKTKKKPRKASSAKSLLIRFRSRCSTMRRRFCL